MSDHKFGKNPSERELRALSTEELLALIQQDIQDLDRAWKERRRAAAKSQSEQPPTPLPPSPPAPSRRRRPAKPSARPAGDLLEALLAEARSEMPPDDLDVFHRVTCCNSHLGDFPPIARVCCPFCGTWHRAADSPRAT